MKKIVSLLLGLLTYGMASAGGSALGSYKGVWANDNAEAVITDSVCIVYFQVDSTMHAVLQMPGVTHKTVFAPDGSVSFQPDGSPIEISESGGLLTICGQRLRKVEDVDIVAPYEMSECLSRFDVGKCLQEWRLGVKYGMQGDMPYCEINTNRHMFVYLVNRSMVYIRAAATRNNDYGTLFFQNIRMMKNQNTGEYTMKISANNSRIARSDLEIDNSKFQPNTCTFSPDGGIYWSLISFEPSMILLNGCGETYQVPRPSVDSDIKEWIRYVAY